MISASWFIPLPWKEPPGDADCGNTAAQPWWSPPRGAAAPTPGDGPSPGAYTDGGQDNQRRAVAPTVIIR